MATFRNFGLSDFLIKALDMLKFTQPTEIQEKAIPLLLEKDLIDFHGQAQTGTGKTLAFGLPLLQKINQQNKSVQALIIAPTRELVLQISQSLKTVAQCSDIVIHPVYGGVSIYDQINVLKKGVHIVVGTPGRLNDHLRRKTLSFTNLKTLVLDEADIMLDMGFREEIDDILLYMPSHRNIWLFSATVKEGITQLAKKHMHSPVVVRISKKMIGSRSVKQHFCVVPMRDRLTALCRIIDSASHFYGFIFCSTKINASEIAERLLKRGYKASALHGDMSQAARNRSIKRFKDREFSILVATDVAARGIDIPDATHVINFRIPEDRESYVHRIGRTGRAGNVGVAITFVMPSEIYILRQLERKFKVKITSMDVPSVDDIAYIKVQEAGEYLATVCHKKKNVTKYSQRLYELVKEYTFDDLVHAMTNSLDDKFLKYLEKEKKITFVPAQKIKKGEFDHSRQREYAQKGLQEIFLNIGSDDGLTKDDVASFLQIHTNLESKQLAKFKMIKRRVFLCVPHAVVNRVIHALEGKQLGGRTVRVRKIDFES